MNIAFISFRLAGTDGVSLETAKLAQIFHRLGHRIYYFAGELDPPGTSQGLLHVPIDGVVLEELAHFVHPEIAWITSRAFGSETKDDQLGARIDKAAAHLESALAAFVVEHAIDLIVPQNVFAIPLNLPLSIALHRLIADSGILTIAHNHDFYWERERFAVTCVPDILKANFPPALSNVRQLVINSQAQKELARRGLDSIYLPNILDFATPPPGVDDYNADLRGEIGVQVGELFFLQPTRVVRRKGIELAIELVSRLADLPIKLVITHPAEFDTADYLAELQSLAARSNVRLHYLAKRFAPQRRPGAQKTYSLWDAYVHADFVTYPSLYEGFGNALLETLYFRKPFLVNRYTVYRDDIEPTGIDAVTIDGRITDATIAEVRGLLRDPERVERMTAHNYEVASRHFSYEAVLEKLRGLLDSAA